MSKKARNSCLAALLLGSCSFIDDSVQNSKRFNFENKAYNLSRSVLNPTNSSNLNQVSSPLNSASSSNSVSGNYVDLAKDSTKIGPLEIYQNNQNDGLRLNVPFLPTIELPFDYNYRSFRDLDNNYFIRADNFMERGFSEMEDFHDWNQNIAGEQIPLNGLGRALKKALFSTEVAKPLKSLSNNISRFSDGPTQFIFGAGSRSDLELKIGGNKIGINYEVRFPSKWSMEIETQYALREGEEDKVMIFFSRRF